ncbi:MAG: HyaD/HybD family hydrogenase maturation endopeptidase [Deltaproteobacteria bacterium]|nr:HyaD/HybD family hydrogenase maturation endopeptidase [Deltaproteobacteria bacterium]
MKKVLILGIGNILLGDEGIGVHAIHALEKELLSEDAELLDGGTLGFDLIPHIIEIEKLIVIDAVKTEGRPGDVFKFKLEDVEVSKKPNFSLHEIGLLEAIEMMKKMGYIPPDTTIIGIVPKDWGGYNLSLSPELEERIPYVVQLVKEELRCMSSQ